MKVKIINKVPPEISLEVETAEDAELMKTIEDITTCSLKDLFLFEFHTLEDEFDRSFRSCRFGWVMKK